MLAPGHFVNSLFLALFSSRQRGWELTLSALTLGTMETDLEPLGSPPGAAVTRPVCHHPPTLPQGRSSPRPQQGLPRALNPTPSTDDVSNN